MLCFFFFLFRSPKMFLFDWMFDVLSYLGLYQKNAKILFLGLDNAGKTTLLYMLKDGRLTVNDPTIHPTMQELIIGKIRFRTFDLGGHENARRVWKDYYTSVDAVVFLVDAANPKRFEESRSELTHLLSSDDLKDVPFLILGNKIDDPMARPEDELRYSLGLHQLTTGKTGKVNSGIRPIEVFMCSIWNQQGYKEGFRWLSQYL
eukprot:GCRY01001821.1.p1 GENE.GCRY01001821.1~~GCRY01001821.1.p1  ORF type:complete len:204 (+),score=31.35 GCRY01001821.1:590-1201(+)